MASELLTSWQVTPGLLAHPCKRLRSLRLAAAAAAWSDRHISFIDSNKGRFSALGIGCEVGRGVSGYTQSVSETLGLGPTDTS